MNIPLSVQSSIKNNEQYLKIFHNGQVREIKSPILPYVYSKQGMKLQYAVGSQDVDKILYSSRKKETITRHEFKTVNEVSRLNAFLKKKGLEKDVWENHIRFTERCLIDRPDFYTQYPHTGDLKPLFLDIETLSKDNIDQGDIIAIGTGFVADGSLVIHIIQGQEENIINEFINYINNLQFNMIVGYNLRGFDIARIYERSKQYELSDKFYNAIKDKFQYDMYDTIMGDQTLYGIKNRKLKTVAKWYNIPCIELDTYNTWKYTEKEIYEYNKSDIEVTSKVYDLYIDRSIALANLLNIPLNMVLEGTATFIPRIVLAQGFYKKGFVTDVSNIEKYPEICKKGKGKRIQGALKGIEQIGLFKPITKLDFKGMYPSIQMTTNLSPENTQIIGFEKYGKFNVNKDNDKITYYIPDKNINKNVVVEVHNEEGMMVQELKKLRNIRGDIKTQLANERDKSIIKGLDSTQCSTKIISNCFYGYATNNHAQYCDIGIGIVTTGLARMAITYVMDYIRQKYGNIILEWDTDGVYLSTDLTGNEVKDIENKLTGWITEHVGRVSELELDKESYKAGYFHKIANYILLRHDNQIRLTGGAMKGSNKCRLWDNAITQISEKLLNGEKVNKLVKHYMNPDNWEMDDLIMRVSMGKPLNKYKSEGCLSAKLAYQGKSVGLPVKVGFQFEYIKTNRGYLIKQLVAKKSWIDTQYYQGMLNKMFGNLGLLKTPEEIEAEKNPTIFQVANKVQEDELKKLWEDEQNETNRNQRNAVKPSKSWFVNA